MQKPQANTQNKQQEDEIIISMLVAASENNVIGKDNRLPWHLPNDLKYFKNLTWGMPIVMGRKTFDSIGKPLPGRKSIVITRNRNWSVKDVATVHGIEEAVALSKSYGVKEIFLIGGAAVFASAMPSARRLYFTRIHHHFDGDVFLPDIDLNEWQLVKSHDHPADAKNAYAHTYEVWERSEKSKGKS